MTAPAPVTFDDPAWREEERRCLAGIRRGDRASFERLYAVLAPPLYTRVLLPRLGDAQAAEDVLSETFARLVARPDSYQDRGAGLWSWLATVAANGARDLHRARARGGRALVGYEALVAPLLDAAAAPDDDALDGPKLRAAVARALAGLNPRYRRALELRFFEDRERADCAAALEIKIGTFDVLLLRALRALRAAWLDSGGSAHE